MSRKKNLSSIVDLQPGRIVMEDEHISTLPELLVQDPSSQPFDPESFDKDVKINIIKLGRNFMEFDLVGVAPSIANAIRRITIAEVPTIAIETVFVVNNTSIIPDEVLSHRLGLIPIHADPRKFDFPTGEPTDVNTIVFELREKCVPIKGSPVNAVLEKKYLNSSVFSGSLKWIPQGSQEEAFADEPLRPCQNDILIAKLRPDQEIDLELHCIKGIACSSYRLLPKITIIDDITGDDAVKFANCFPTGVIEIKKIKGVDTAIVKSARKDTVSRECLRHPEFADKYSRVCASAAIMPVYIVEHLDDELYNWSAYEYLSMIECARPNQVIFTNARFESPTAWKHLTNFEILPQSISSLNVSREKICLLDSEAPNLLEPEDAGSFSHFLFGGILGNTDEFDFDRTKVLRDMGFPSRNLGTVQMTTDTALKTTKEIIENQLSFDSLQFVDRPIIKSDANESLVLNFRFMADENGIPAIPKGIRDLLLEDIDDFDLNRLE